MSKGPQIQEINIQLSLFYYPPGCRLKELPEDFNEGNYLNLNPDVAQAGMDPVRHYMLYGWIEGRKWR